VRRLLLIGVSALAVALAAVAATRSATQPIRQADCRQSLVIVLFWPKGHGAIPSVGLGRYRTPNAAVFKYSKHGYPSKNLLVLGDAKQRAQFGSICKFQSGPGPSGTIAQRLSAHRARALSCRIPTGGVERTKPIKNGLQIDLGAPGTRVVSIKLHPTGSSADFSHSWCNAGNPPA
jgi:hypothetical protein